MNTLVVYAVVAVWAFKAFLVKGNLNITESGSNKVGSTTYSLACHITGYSSLATWDRGTSNVGQCPLAGCLASTDSRYSFRNDAGAIYVDFSELTADENEVIWTCKHGFDPSDVFTVSVDTTILIIVVLILSGIIIGIDIAGNTSTNCVGLLGIHYSRYRKKNVLKVFRLYPSLGSRVHVTVNHDVSRTENTKKVEINKENNKASIIIAEVAQDHYDVYKLYITLNSICESEDVKIEDLMRKPIGYRKDNKIENLTTTDEHLMRKPIGYRKDNKIENLTTTDEDLMRRPIGYRKDNKIESEIKIEIHFEVNHEEVVTIRKPHNYIFKDKYKMFDVTFMGIQIVVVAVIFQLISLITTASLLPLLYYVYGEYDTAVVIPVSFALVVPVAPLGTGLFVLTVICCRGKKDEKTSSVDDSSRRCRTALIFIIIIFPIAWLLLIAMLIVNQCRHYHEKSDGDFLKNVPKDRHLPITKLHDTDEDNKNGNAGIKKQSKKERKERQKSNIQEDDPLEPAKHSEKREIGSIIEQVNLNASHIDDVKF